MNMENQDNIRPWGYYENLAEGDNHKVKRIVVHPGRRLSLQSHGRRAEHWYMVQGRAVVTLDDRGIKLGPGEAVDVGLGVKHRIENTGDGDLVFIEVQTGDYFGEDDIIRYEDDFGRA